VRLARQIMQLIRYSNGGFTHESIMRLTFTQFYEYHDALTWCLNSETEKGKKENEKADRREELGNITREEVEQIKEKARRHKEAQLKKATKNHG
jgi:hypothetical protein